jgi:hypothetical protein
VGRASSDCGSAPSPAQQKTIRPGKAQMERSEVCRGVDQGSIDSAAGRLQVLLARAIDDLTDELVERPELTGDGDAAADPELGCRLREWALIKVRIKSRPGLGIGSGDRYAVCSPASSSSPAGSPVTTVSDPHHRASRLP